MTAKNQRWWLTKDSGSWSSSDGGTHLRPGRRPGPHGRVEPGVPTRRVGGRRNRSRGRGQVRRSQPGRTAPTHAVVASRPRPRRRPRPGVRLRHRGGRPRVHHVALPVRARRGGTRVTESYEVKWIPRGPASSTFRPTGIASCARHAPHARAAQGRRRGNDRAAANRDPGRRARRLSYSMPDKGEAVWFAAVCSSTRRPVPRPVTSRSLRSTARCRIATSPPSPRGRGLVHPRRGPHVLAGRRGAGRWARARSSSGRAMVDHRFRVDSEEARFLLPTDRVRVRGLHAHLRLARDGADDATPRRTRTCDRRLLARRCTKAPDSTSCPNTPRETRRQP